MCTISSIKTTLFVLIIINFKDSMFSKNITLMASISYGMYVAAHFVRFIAEQLLFAEYKINLNWTSFGGVMDP